MSGRQRVAIWVAVIVVLGGTAATPLLLRLTKRQPISLKGAVIRQDTDSQKELPIADVEITAAAGLAAGECKSDPSGFFSLSLPKEVRRGQPVTLKFRHPDYEPLDLNQFTGDKLYIARMVPRVRQTQDSNRPQVVVANVRVRYSVKNTTTVNIGSAVKTFQVVNKGDIPCKGQHPCSPDGKWRATIASAFLDAREGNEFQNARVSCIAGPCPFTKIDGDGFSQGGRNISVSARNWSDTTTFMLEAEVFHPMESDLVRQFYPVIFGQGLDFTLPAAAEGVSIEAEIDGSAIVFPLGPNLFLSWADCNARLNKDKTRVYECELKPGYRFR
jgi:hypothetical protein